MTLCYDKHFEVKNKWQNQRVSKRFKNKLDGFRYKDHGFIREKLKQNERKKEMDLEDYELCVDYNSIPVWDCARCTYTNIERKSLCQICGASYGSITSDKYSVCDTTANYTRSNNMTLGEFCKNVWDALSLPVWICSQCCYCNIEQLPNCLICSHPYAQTVKTEEIYIENYEEFDVEDDDKQNTSNIHNTETIITKSIQPQTKIETIHKTIQVSVTIKLTPNKLYQKEKSRRLELNNEDILRHTLLEARLDIQNVKAQLIKTYDYIPVIKNMDGSYTAYGDNIVVPIKCKYRNRFGEFGYYPNNNPLKSIAEFIWRAQYPFLESIECPRWEFQYPQHKNIRSPAMTQCILDSVLAFLPLKDVVVAILFRLLGYDEVDVVKMHTTFEHDAAYFAKYKINRNKDFEKDVFISRNNEKLPFTVTSSAYTTVKSRKLDRFSKLTEIGYNYSGDAPYAANNYWNERNKKITHRWTGTYWTKAWDAKLMKYNKKEPRNRHKRKMKRGRKSRRYMQDIKQFYPKKYLYFCTCNHSIGWPKPRKRQRNKQRRNAKFKSRYNTSYYWNYLWSWRKTHNPRYCNEIAKWYLMKDKRYIDRKWSAYWKLNERHKNNIEKYKNLHKVSSKRKNV